MNYGLFDMFEEKIATAIDLLKRANEDDFLYLMYSGGKDSSVLFDIMLSYLNKKKYKIIMAHSVMEHQITVDILLEKIKYVGGDVQYEIIEIDGWLDVCFTKCYSVPSYHYRYCTSQKIKAGNMIRKTNKGTFVIGSRKNESSLRSSIFKNKKGYKNSICPIIDWDENDVWRYLLEVSEFKDINEKLHNYYLENNLKRLNCIICPLSTSCRHHRLSTGRLALKIARAMYEKNSWNDYYERINSKCFLKLDIYRQLLDCVKNDEENFGIKLMKLNYDEAWNNLLLARENKIKSII